MDLERHRLLIKLDPASKSTLNKHSKMPNYIIHSLVHKKGLDRQRVGKQTSGQNVKGEKQI